MATGEPLNKKIQDADQLIKACAVLENEIMELKASYDMYFVGVDRKPPSKRHEELKKRIQALRGAYTRHTGAKFRINGVQNKLQTFERLWDRTLKEIEAGTYKSDLFKLRRKLEKDAKDAGKPRKNKGGLDDIAITEAIDIEEVSPTLSSWAAAAKPTAPVQVGTKPAITQISARPGPPVPAARPGAQPAPATGSRPAVAPAGARPPTGSFPPAGARPPTGPNPAIAPSASRPPAPVAAAARPGGGSGNLSDDKVKAIYDAYITAKRRCNEDTSKISYDQVAASLKKQVPELMKQHNAKAVEFKVVIKDGKATLKAVPKT